MHIELYKHVLTGESWGFKTPEQMPRKNWDRHEPWNSVKPIFYPKELGFPLTQVDS